MSNSNKKAKEELIRLYGAECFIERLHLRPEESKVYTGSQLKYMKKYEKQLKQLTYHHILEKHLGGRATVENGALLSEGNHRWFNQQSKENQDKMNEAFQELKDKLDKARECKIELVDTLDINIHINTAEISFSDEIKPPKEKFNRAEIKRETRNKIRDWEERKMITTETRYESYKEIIDKKKLRYNQILDRLDRPKTAKQIAVELFELGLIPSTERNYTAPRLTELADIGIVSVVGKTKCEYTGKQVALYKKSDNLEKLIKENEKHISM